MFKHLNKRTKVLLWVLLGVVVVVAGVLTYGIATGRISSFADVYTNPVGTIKGEVYGQQTLNGIAGARVTAGKQPINFFGGGGVTYSVYTDVNGNYSFVNIPSGQYIITADGGCGATNSQALKLPSGITQEVNLALQETPYLTGFVYFNSSTKADSSVSVYLFKASDWNYDNPPYLRAVAQTTTNKNGHYNISCKEIGGESYVVVAVTSGHRSYENKFTAHLPFNDEDIFFSYAE